MKVSMSVFITVMVVLLIGVPSVLRAFFGDYPWQIRFVVTAVLVLALGVAIWPSIDRKKEEEKASSEAKEDKQDKKEDFKQK